MGPNRWRRTVIRQEEQIWFSQDLIVFMCFAARPDEFYLLGFAGRDMSSSARAYLRPAQGKSTSFSNLGITQV
jgi:hypothetical protein